MELSDFVSRCIHYSEVLFKAAQTVLMDDAVWTVQKEVIQKLVGHITELVKCLFVSK